MRWFLVIASVCAAVPGRAQPRYGGALGGRASNLAGDVASDTTLSVALEGIVELPLGEHWSVAAEPNIGSTGSGTYDLLYAALPIVARVRYPIGPAWRVSLNVGLTANILVKAERTDDTGRENIRDQLRWWDVGLVVGAGVERGKLFAELRYARGLVTIADVGDVFTTEVGLWIGIVR